MGSEPVVRTPMARRFWWRALLAGLIIAAPQAVLAASLSIEALANYEGVDRQRRLIEGAKKEGTLSLYTSLPVEDMSVLNAAFEKTYGIKVRMWRASCDKVLQRVLAEHQASRAEVDIIECNAPPLEAMHREGVLQSVRAPGQSDLIAAAVPAHREWVGTRLNVFVHAYNTKLVQKDELPKSYGELLNPRWKGRLSIEATDDDWFANVVRGLGEEKGLKLFRDIVAQNGLSVRRGHTLLTNLVASGEVPFALTVYNFTAEQVKQKGAPFDWFVLSPAIARANGVALAKRSPHPHAALLYYDFMIGDEGQQILYKRDFVPTSKKIDTPLNRGPLVIIDPKVVLDESAKWTKLYDEIVVKQFK
jgi:iron(III) transport system substrate-binding protein